MEELDFLEMPSVEHIVPPVAVAAGEYELIIVNLKMGMDKNDHPFIQPLFKIINELNSKAFTKYIKIPSVDLDEDKLEGVQRGLRYFEDCFGLPAIGGKVSKDDIKGLRGKAILKVVGSEEDEYGIQNEVARWLPKE